MNKEALDWSKERFDIIKKFHNENDSEALKALAIIKGEPTWVIDGKQKYLYETAPDLIRIIEQALTQEVSKDTNVEEVLKEFDFLISESNRLSRVESGNMGHLRIKNAIKLIRNYITNVPKEVDSKIVDYIMSLLVKIDNKDGRSYVDDIEDKLLNKILKQFDKITQTKCWGFNLNEDDTIAGCGNCGSDEATIEHEFCPSCDAKLQKLNVPKDVPNQLAKKMFEALGYKLIKNNRNEILYEKDLSNNIIIFPEFKSYAKFSKIKLSQRGTFTYEEHQAMTQQLRELED